MMKKLFMMCFVVWISLGVGMAWEYPVKIVEGKFCGNDEPMCQIPLPKIKNADYLSYQHNGLYRRIYTVLWGGTYFGGWDFGLGAHKGVDIASKLGTPIYAIGSGEVIVAGVRGDRGKVVSIRHHFAGKELVSNYAHLDEILVEEGAYVQEGDMIGKMGTTGNSTGPHLHFQIDTNQGKHPYHPNGCGGETLMQIVNEAKCWDIIKKNTLDPILFLETQGAIFASEVSTTSERESYFLLPQDLHIMLTGSVMKLGATSSLIISHNKNDGFLKEELIIDGGDGLEILPDRISYLGSKREVFVKSKKSGLQVVKVRYGNNVLKEILVFVLDDEMIARLRRDFSGNEFVRQILAQL